MDKYREDGNTGLMKEGRLQNMGTPIKSGGMKG